MNIYTREKRIKVAGTTITRHSVQRYDSNEVYVIIV